MRFLIFAALSLAVASRTEAQGAWAITAEFGLARFSGHAEGDAATAAATGHPSSSMTWGLRVDRTLGPVRLSAGVLHASSGVEFESEEISATARGVLSLLEFAPDISVALARIGQGTARLHGGLSVARWSPDGDDARTTLGGLGALSLDLPLTYHAAVAVRWEGVLSGSVFDSDDLPAGFERKRGFRQRLGLGVRYHW